ncbi:amidohydrolase [Gryllotalpicola protaetiae]|uniref:Peptidase M20 domain-containing protein 2 n=1 Tax=Gryllotalpicola protaetiae TaxID=2419771 RepID=A0A387C081_9MICO|nr:amidohydrolase [Gryllotalpicola protaetiae]AYG03961.1 M20 family peptidase [Gryllotalpicola protaetiae]
MTRDLSRPETPDRSYADALQARTERLADAAEYVTSPYEGAPAELAAEVGATVDELAPEIVALSHRVFETPEEAFQEVRSAAAVAEAVARLAGAPVRRGVYGLETAVEASAGPAPRAGTATVAILAEYDALPGIGHGCGHNLIAASAVGAFAALARLGDRLPGRVVLLGTPAEEGNSGKELMARQGAFDGVDAAIMAHGFGYDAIDQPFIGRRILRMEFEGVPAHASASPFLGRNALDAATLAYQAVGLLRQHLPPSDRVHGIVKEGGERPSVIPRRAVLEFYLRSHRADTLKELSRRLDDIAHGAALATGTGVTLHWDPQPGTLPTRFNRPLSERWAVHQAARGRKALTSAVVPVELAASTDFGNVSVRVPGIHPVIKVSPPEIALHTAEFAEWARSAAGDEAATDAAFGLALTALDFLADASLREAARADFEAAGGVLDVEEYFA